MDLKLKKELLCIHNIIRKVQNKLDDCFENNPYSIRCAYSDDYGKFESIFSAKENACHKLPSLCDSEAKSCFSAVVFMKETREIASYVLFSQHEVNKESLAFLPEGDYPNFINIDFTCTPIKYRRRGLSILLRYVVILFAMQENMPVSSDTNELSAPLLINKFGFTKEEDYLALFNFNANTYLEPTAVNKEAIAKRFENICQQVR